MKSGRDFIGRAALVAVAGQPLKKRFAGFVLEDEAVVLVGRETILRDGVQVGYLTSGGYGYTVGRPIGYGYVRNAEGVSDGWLAEGRYELVVAGEVCAARVAMGALYDPVGVRVKA